MFNFGRAAFQNKNERKYNYLNEGYKKVEQFYTFRYSNELATLHIALKNSSNFYGLSKQILGSSHVLDCSYKNGKERAKIHINKDIIAYEQNEVKTRMTTAQHFKTAGLKLVI